VNVYGWRKSMMVNQDGGNERFFYDLCKEIYKEFELNVIRFQKEKFLKKQGKFGRQLPF
jgi:creatinine amidohydrolase/Fe(II)-dependent formamide hydrolase-like protein